MPSFHLARSSTLLGRPLIRWAHPGLVLYSVHSSIDPLARRLSEKTVISGHRDYRTRLLEPSCPELAPRRRSTSWHDLSVHHSHTPDTRTSTACSHRSLSSFRSSLGWPGNLSTPAGAWFCRSDARKLRLKLTARIISSHTPPCHRAYELSGCADTCPASVRPTTHTRSVFVTGEMVV